MVRTEDACEIIQFALQNGIKVYVDGGWGVDALLGRESRIHNDIDLHCFEFTDGGIVYEGDLFPSETFSGIGKIRDLTVSCIEPFSQVMFHLGYEHDENDVHDVMLLCDAFQIAIPDEYKD